MKWSNLNNSANVGALENILENTPTITSIHHHPSEEISISESLRSFVLKSSETSCNSNNINNITTVKWVMRAKATRVKRT